MIALRVSSVCKLLSAMALSLPVLVGAAAAGPLVDAALYANDRTYLFQGSSYFRLNGNKVEGGYPKYLDEWKKMPARFMNGIDAALFFPDNGKIYMFKGAEYVRISRITVDDGYPKRIAENWKGLPPRFHADLDAALYRDGHAYFFKGGEYVRFTGTKMDNGYPRALPGGWSLPKGGYRTGLDAALDRPDGKNYFFADESYVRLTDTKLDGGYPAPMSNWQGLFTAEPRGSGLISSGTIHIRLHVVALVDDTGYYGTDVSRKGFANLVALTNRHFRDTGIQFDYDPATDFEQIEDTAANADQTIRQFGNALAGKRPSKMLVILRYGGQVAADGTRIATGNGNAYPPPNDEFRPPHFQRDEVQNYVALPNQSALITQSDSFMSHEFGHFLGLYHTFPGWTHECNEVFGHVGCRPDGSVPSVDAVIGAALDYASNVLIGSGEGNFDGDGLSDTPPDPGPYLYNRLGRNFCTQPQLNVSGNSSYGKPGALSFRPSTTNIMSYYGSCNDGNVDRPRAERFTNQQVQRMRRTLTTGGRKGLTD